MTQFSPAFNLPRFKRKGLYAVYGGIRSPFYFTNSVVIEGQPLKLNGGDSWQKVTANLLLAPCVMGNSDGPRVIGLAMQNTYNDNLTGQLGQLRGYHFPNDTSQRLDGSPIGVLTGQGWATLENFTGNVAAHEQMGVGPSGLLAGVTSSSLATNDQCPVWAETTAPGGAMMGVNGETYPLPPGASANAIRIRFDFRFVSGNNN